ncbi:hypothetical protein KAFR_0K02000 [Kazachstania africana CBS 2517]|uniref:High osmolarity signaling protein SHO1 n=1 Tax=Kazachstania africana (strain ATCC 22294 / BCRC 22015 / CBS 2517 / CECT 1963 / NBRC 1671 / NRRL Y-8276) TaxID=1071382 RepID=H2B1Q4_KAZAF|nr:hypothetical protein KAFR_0K02000 [Kazachstania africana CBS 2517]CCF60554.1 hypothetical protein KAFR_0K02000 [Kazachstania africana CBS 2517]
MVFLSGSQARAHRSRNRIDHTFSLGNLFGDPFAIASILAATISWIIALSGSIAAASSNESFPRFTWWGIAYQFLLLCLMVVFYCYDVISYYKSFLTAAMGVALVYNTNSATNLIYSDGSKKAAASAGVILLSIINIIWMFYYGGDNASPTNKWIDSYSLHGMKPSPYEITLLRARRRSSKIPQRRNNRDVPNSNAYTDVSPQNYVSSTALADFENTEPSYAVNNNAPFTEIPQSTNEDTFLSMPSNGNTESTMGDTLGLYSDIADDNFAYVAKALYSYQADESDQYEISFEQGEILRVSDIEGRWWKAKRENGETGIIPSNYVQLINSETNI